MDEADIKAAVLTRIRRKAHGRALPIVTSEFSLNGTGIRSDLAILDGSKFYGIEIKSASDTLKRLPKQMEGYERYFDSTQLYIASRHATGLDEVNLRGAEVWMIDEAAECVLHSSGQLRKISGQWLLHLLTADDERRALRAIGSAIIEHSESTVDKMRRCQFETLFARRYSRTSETFWRTVHGRRITSDDLKLLSRFHAGRQQQRTLDEQRAESWIKWTLAMQNASSSA